MPDRFCNNKYLYTKKMNNRTSQINSITEAFISAFGQLDKEDLNWSPDPNTWSIARNVDHLIVINSTYFPIFDAIKSGNFREPFMGRFGFWVNWMGSFILKFVQPERKHKIKTMPLWEPRTGNIDADILQKFDDHQRVLGKYMEELSDNRTVIASPASKYMVYSLDKALDIIIAHERRHLEQARDVLGMLKSAKNE